MSEPLILKLKGTVLYENKSGETEDITLSESLSNYKCIEIFYQVGSVKKSEKVEVILNDYANLSLTDYIDPYMWFHTKTMQMAETQLKVIRYKEYRFKDSTDWSPYGSEVDSILITKVVGYK